MHALETHEFHVELDVPGLSDELTELVCEAGFDDALLCQDDRIVYLKFEREGRSRDAVVAQTLKQLRAAQFPIVVSMKPLVAN
jgi:hypothetical protein